MNGAEIFLECLKKEGVTTIFGYPGSVKLAQYRIDYQLGAFPAQEAWILTSNAQTLNEKEKQETALVLKHLEKATRRIFPEHYSKEAKNKTLELWKPKN